MLIKKIKYIVMMCTIFFVDHASACSCGDMDIARIDKGSEIVFIGNLKSKRWFSSNYILNDLKFYKGESLNEVEVSSEKSSMSCGVKFEHNVPYVIFAYRREGKLWVDGCSSWAITDKYQKYTDRFNKFYKLEDENKIQVKESVNVHEASHKAN